MLVEATGSMRAAAVPHQGCCWKIPREAWSLPTPWPGEALPAGSLGLASTRSPDSASPVMSAITAAWSPPRATATAATTRPLAAATSGIPAIGPDVAQTDPEIRPLWAVASPTPLSRRRNPVSPLIAAALIPAEATGRERVMLGLPAGGYTIGFCSEYCRTQEGISNTAEPKGTSALSAALLHNSKK